MPFPGSAGSVWAANTWAANSWLEDAWAGAVEALVQAARLIRKSAEFSTTFLVRAYGKAVASGQDPLVRSGVKIYR